MRGLPTKRLVEKTSRLRCAAAGTSDPAAATRFALRSVARRHRALSEEIAELVAQIERLSREAAPELVVALDGVGPDTAATLLAAAGDNPERLKSEAAFAHLCGTAPVPASSGKVVPHCLNPGGNRDANRAALHVVALNRLRRDPRTQEYLARRTSEGKSKKEAMLEALHRPRDLPGDLTGRCGQRPAGLTNIGASRFRRYVVVLEPRGGRPRRRLLAGAVCRLTSNRCKPRRKPHDP